MVQDKCIVCSTSVTNYTPQYCCDGFMCACEGRPIEPPICERCETLLSAEKDVQKHAALLAKLKETKS